MLSRAGHTIVNKIITVNKTCAHNCDAPSNHESKSWLFEDKSNIQLKQRQIL